MPTFLECYEKLNAVVLKLSWLSVYAYMKHDEDTRDSTYTALLSRVDDLEMKLSGAVSFMTGAHSSTRPRRSRLSPPTPNLRTTTIR